jgi:hypothetical protein
LLGLTPDLTIELAIGANPVRSNTGVAVDARIGNRGNEVAGSIQAVFEIPAAGVEVHDLPGDCTAVGSTVVQQGKLPAEKPWSVVCQLGTLTPGSVVDLTFSITTGIPGTHVIAASVQDGDTHRVTADSPLFVLPDGPAVLPAFQEPGRSNRLNRISA